MVIEVSGDILLSQAGAIAHGISPNDDFKQGLALALREQWPAMYKDFRRYCQTYHPKLGTLWSWKGPNSPIIINLFTQDSAPAHESRPGKATLPHVNHALQALKKEAQAQGVTSVAITRVATGVGGLDWDEVKPLIQNTLKDLGMPVYVYANYKKGVTAQEG
jgi:O-acetyl-ADP-ribose deacetylase (regulator of RNase III)